MSPEFRQLLDACVTQQDYIWFLALLAWAGVITAGFKRTAERAAPPGWLLALAAASALSALLELALLAQDLKVPYTRFDLAMGVAQAGCTAALAWPALAGRYAAAARIAVLVTLAAVAALRFWFPLEAGCALALSQALALLTLWQRRPRPFVSGVFVLLLLQPIVATHGPWAAAIGQARLTTDWSRFALPAAGSSLCAGLLLATTLWRQRVRDLESNAALRRDLRRALIILACWLVTGVGLTIQFGRVTRRVFEENFLRRVEIAALTLDPAALATALGPDLRIESIKRSRYSDGSEVDVATIPHTAAPVFDQLRTQLGRLRRASIDFEFINIATWRGGHLVVIDSSAHTQPAVRHVIDHALTPTDLERLARRAPFFEGPMRTTWGTLFSVKTPLFDPAGRLLGWLIIDVEATRWASSFVDARLQTMVLVGVGVVLWIVAVAYRFRRAAREAAEEKAQAATAADRTKSAFLAKVSHELRTPIQSILGYSELLEGTALSPSGRAWLASLRTHSGIMLRLVNDLIDLGALQSGLFQLSPAPTDPRLLIRECTEALQPAADAKGLAFRVVVDPALPPWVMADSVRVRQVLLNILNNAIKFTPSGEVRLHAGLAGSELEFLVTDTGPGIPLEQRNRLFQPFARLDPAAGEGSGLGLALVQALCFAMHGSIELLDSAPGGAAFRVRLPLPPCDSPAGAASADPSGAGDFAGRRVLIAEDNPLVRELLATFLTDNGAEVSVVGDGPGAVALARTRPFDLLLLDIALPGLDGLAVAETLRREGPPRLRILGLSAHADAHAELRARAAGMDLFLAKPVSLARLSEALHRLFPRGPEEAPRLEQKIPDARLRARLWTEFHRETPRVLADMRAALAAADWPALRRHAHYLKNSADVLGAETLQYACAELSGAQRLSPAAASQLVARIEEAAAGIAAPGKSPERLGLN